MKIIYVTYDGLEEPLGQSQVLPYLDGLARRGHQVDIISFDKPGVSRRWREPVVGGVGWTALRYHKHPTVPATAFDMLQGLAATALTSVLHGADLIHVRSYVPAALALPWVMASRVPMLFDTRGFWIDEKVDGGAWPAGDWKYRAAKRIERVLYRRADAITVVTRAAQRYLRRAYAFRSEIAAPIHVIPGSADVTRFSPEVERDPALTSRLSGARVLGYVGSLGTWYMEATMARFYLAWREAVRREAGPAKATRFLIVSRSQADELPRVLHEAGAADELVQHGVPHRDVPAVIRWAEAAVCFRKPSPSSLAGSPVKLGEMLACGLPVAANVIGDIADVFRGSSAGVLLDETTSDTLQRAARDLEAAARRPGVAQAARAVALRWFDLTAAIDAYDALYRSMPRRHGGRSTARDEGWPRQD